MARRWFFSAILAVVTAAALIASTIGLGTASASPARPATAAAAAGTQLPVHVPATLHGVAGHLNGTVPKFTASSGNVLAHLVFTSFTSNTGHITTFGSPITRNDRVIGAAPANVCQILNLTLGPLHLNLLGLVVDLNRVHLRITAHRGPGNLLGNLLCAVANLLNSSAPAANQAALLNDVVGALGILGRL